MLRSLIDRLQYALIGLFFGSVLGCVGWYLIVGLGNSFHRLYPELDALANTGIGTWVKYVGGTFALLGFILKDRIGDVAGEASAELYRTEARRNTFPFSSHGILLLAVAAAIVLLWKLSH